MKSRRFLTMWRSLGIAVVLALLMALAAPAVQPAAQAATPAEINASIDKGLAWLATQQNADGAWPQSYYVGATGLAVLKFETHAIFMGKSPFDPTYQYSTNVQKGLDYIFNNSHSIAIGPQTAGNPDTNGNGIGVRAYHPGNSSHEMYETGIALMAINASNDPARVVGVGSQAGRTYAAVAQDIVDFIAWAQEEGLGHPPSRGGWRYTANYGDSDNSISGYVTLGLSYAESGAPWGFGLTVPPFVLSEMNFFINNLQDPVNGDADDGGSWYVPQNWTWINILKTGNLLSEMAIYGNNQTTQRVKDAVDYIERHWNDANQDPGWGKVGGVNYQACFTTMKGFQALGIELIDLNGDNVPETNWYNEMADRIVNTQNADGSWPGDTWGGSMLTTAWAMLTLEKAAPPALSLAPAFDINPVNTSHTVTATYKVGGVAQAGVTINFLVTAGPNVGDSGSDVTDASGQATFTYIGDGGIGTDTIKATAVDPTGAPLVSADATKSWEGGTPPTVGGTISFTEGAGSSSGGIAILAVAVIGAFAVLAVAGRRYVARRR